MELKMFNGIFNRVVPQAFLTGLRRDGAASSAQAGVTHAKICFHPTTLTCPADILSRSRERGNNRVASVEIFGPVLSVMTFRTPEEAFKRANNIPCGLSAGVWTDKSFRHLTPALSPFEAEREESFKMVNKLRAGVVWANTYNKFDPTSPFGGYKESGFGREGGLHGLAAYCRLD